MAVSDEIRPVGGSAPGPDGAVRISPRVDLTNRDRTLSSSRGRWTTLRRFARQSPIGVFAAVILISALAVALFGPFIARVGDPQAINPLAMFAPPSADYPMGGDDLGRSVFARLVFALRISFALATISALLAAALGTLLGLVAGYTGGLLDEIFMRITDMLFAFPTLLLAILVATVLGPGISGVVITIVVATVPVFSRVARGPTLSVRASEYAVASRVIGASPARTLFRHVLPNVATPLLVQLAFTLSGALVAEGALSFLGLGVQPPTPSLGSLLSNGKTYMEIAPWTMLFPGLTLAAAILAINLLGDEFQRFTDPRQRGR
ncbi:MAG: Dipeptide transport system permease protein DppC [uncultured Thermomicrobiales bacterium]|uniref:Dipeptide transport system permease protein DppC n=1 Tax=uncultured Thermomicrobiales bacterium TaxID=1645740 RepID=A0A6J4UDL4_9BACT|nr:MAG: Dipeptide transport system permease protein DppC [uncultured Thermomicrobiales bacterium]